MKFEEALPLLRDGKMIGRCDNLYGWRYIKYDPKKKMLVAFFRNWDGTFFSERSPKIFGKALFDDKWEEYHYGTFYVVWAKFEFSKSRCFVASTKTEEEAKYEASIYSDREESGYYAVEEH